MTVIWEEAKLIVIATLLITAAVVVAPGLATAAPEDSRTYCQRISRGSYQSEAFCLEAEAKAYQELASRSPVEQRILDYCNRIARSWESMKYCIESEEAAR